MVIGEAMAAGLSVICSTNTGGGELLSDGDSGFLIPVADSAALAAKIAWCVNNRCEVEAMGQRAKSIASQYTWADYGTRMLEKYTQIIKT
jgi:glycosyltransferase involved in cell wall biosynthesis